MSCFVSHIVVANIDIVQFSLDSWALQNINNTYINNSDVEYKINILFTNTRAAVYMYEFIFQPATNIFCSDESLHGNKAYWGQK